MTDEALRSVKFNGYEPRCKACNYPGHEEHDKALLAGKISDSDYARIVGCTSPSIARHRSHISEEIAQSAKAQEIANADSLLDELQRARQRTYDLLDKAEEAASVKVYGAPVQYLREIREQIKLLFELEGRIQSQPQVNILINPKWIELRTLIVKALEPYPEAKRAVVNALP